MSTPTDDDRITVAMFDPQPVLRDGDVLTFDGDTYQVHRDSRLIATGKVNAEPRALPDGWPFSYSMPEP